MIARQYEPAPGYTIPGVSVPGGPTEEQATQAAVDYGWLLAVLLLCAVGLGVGRYITKRIDFKLLAGLIAVGAIAYQVGKGGS